ncbi:hypothetical protein Droror1_Dr00027559 [Drosera rotundifolia]
MRLYPLTPHVASSSDTMLASPKPSLLFSITLTHHKRTETAKAKDAATGFRGGFVWTWLWFVQPCSWIWVVLEPGVEMIELVRDVLILFSCGGGYVRTAVVAGRGATKVLLDVVVWGFGLGVTSQGRKAVGLGLVDFGDLCKFGV